MRDGGGVKPAIFVSYLLKKKEETALVSAVSSSFLYTLNKPPKPLTSDDT
jgi:hypothetical protein